MNNINLYEMILIFLIHFFGDFVLQTHWQATNKSKDNRALTMHVSTYSLVWVLPMSILFYMGPYNFIGSIFMGIIFSLITFGCHWVTDYYTSRLNSKLWAKGDVHNFFVSVGFDQVLHYAQLFTTYYILNTL